MYELLHNDRVIGGIDEDSTMKSIEFYSKFVKEIFINQFKNCRNV